MTRLELSRRYFDWMYHKVCAGKRASYRKLLRHLDRLEFNYTLPLDANRAEDGVDLRYTFGEEKNLDMAAVAKLLDARECTVLEMMVALCLRCEYIMGDSDIGDRTSNWFWSMLRSLELERMTDERFDRHIVDAHIDRFLNKEYWADGHGGLFTVPGTRDACHIDIWQQACRYINYVREGGVS